MYFKNWLEFTAYLDSRGLFRMNPGIGRVSGVLDALGLRRPSMPSAQVVGTNGKGSCCAFLASLARAHGLSCGVHSSPHFVSVRERVRIFRPGGSAGGSLPPESLWLEAANAVMETHIRSVFLQGVLLESIDNIPSHLYGLKPFAETFCRCCDDASISRLEGALMYGRLAGADALVFGVLDVKQLEDCVKAFSSPMQQDWIQETASRFAEIPEGMIMPNLWKK